MRSTLCLRLLSLVGLSSRQLRVIAAVFVREMGRILDCGSPENLCTRSVGGISCWVSSVAVMVSWLEAFQGFDSFS